MGMLVVRILADLVLVCHAGFIAFVVGGQVLILVGGWRKWNWVRNRWLRGAHLTAIGLVIAQTWLGLVCPLTDLENKLRVAGGQQPYSAAGFIRHWLQWAIFYEAESWVFTLIYSLFALLVAVSLLVVPPRWQRGRADTSDRPTALTCPRPPSTSAP